MAPATLTPVKPEVVDKTGRGGFSSGNGDRGFGGDDFGEPSRSEWSVPARAYRTGMMMAIAAIVMLFAAFTSAMVVRAGFGGDWMQLALPRILYFNTAILLASSLTLELSKRSLSAGEAGGFSRWLFATAGLGILFVGGQLIAWRELAARGVYLATNPSSSFFYLLTAAHGLHLLGGVIALLYLLLRARRIAANPPRRTPLEVTAIYWHFMDALWIYILILLTVRF